jgi:SAM-dependent methyltransferase
VAVDIQPKMLDRLRRRAAKAGLLERIQIRLAQPESMGLFDLAGAVDFALAFAIVHEVPSASGFFEEACQALKPGGCLLLAEPAGHVNAVEFEAELKDAARAGLELVDRPPIRRSHAALLKKV